MIALLLAIATTWLTSLNDTYTETQVEISNEKSTVHITKWCAGPCYTLTSDNGETRAVSRCDPCLFCWSSHMEIFDEDHTLLATLAPCSDNRYAGCFKLTDPNGLHVATLYIGHCHSTVIGYSSDEVVFSMERAGERWQCHLETDAIDTRAWLIVSAFCTHNFRLNTGESCIS